MVVKSLKNLPYDGHRCRPSPNSSQVRRLRLSKPFRTIVVDPLDPASFVRPLAPKKYKKRNKNLNKFLTHVPSSPRLQKTKHLLKPKWNESYFKICQTPRGLSGDARKASPTKEQMPFAFLTWARVEPKQVFKIQIHAFLKNLKNGDNLNFERTVLSAFSKLAVK